VPFFWAGLEGFCGVSEARRGRYKNVL
jgi:hypothetical protein